MRTYQFIKNGNGEVASVDKITAVTFDESRAPYEMRVYTPATRFGIVFNYDTTAKLWLARKNLDKLMTVTRLRIIKFANWWIMADAVESISDHGNFLRVRMDDSQNFDIMIETREEVESLKKEIEESLINMYALKDLDVDDNE